MRLDYCDTLYIEETIDTIIFTTLHPALRAVRYPALGAGQTSCPQGRSDILPGGISNLPSGHDLDTLPNGRSKMFSLLSYTLPWGQVRDPALRAGHLPFPGSLSNNLS